MKKTLLIFIMLHTLSSQANDIIPIGENNNVLYYRIGGGSNFSLPPINDNQTIRLGADADLSAGYSCGAFNPALSITNTLNDLKNNIDNVEQTILANATGSLAQMPLYFLAKANPSAYNLINNLLLNAHKQIDISTKSCELVKEQISKGQNPYKDWASIGVGDQWKKHLSLTATGDEDINDAKKDVDKHAGDDGVNWTQGNKTSDGSYHAGGANQPPIHVIADAVKSGYNAILMRNLSSDSPAPSSELATQFPTPAAAVTWITNVVGDQTITTCNDASCKASQGGITGRGLLPSITVCNEQNRLYCLDTLRNNLTNLVINKTPLTKENLQVVSTSGLVISPQVINAIRAMDNTQQTMIINKLAQEIATHYVINKALLARTILQTGSQVPVIAANQPAQRIIEQSIQHLDKDIQSLAFESQIRKQMVSDTLSQVINYSTHQQQAAISIPKINPKATLLEDSSVPKEEHK